MNRGLVIPDRTWEAALSDPFVRAHQIGPRMLEIGPRMSPLSIRDQMFRAAVAIDRARYHGLVDGDGPVLIVGGGAAGCAAFARASRLGCSAVLVEKGDVLFGRQAVSESVWVSPTQYDWPAPHCGEHIYPWPGVDSGQVELGWTAGYGHEIANQWFLALQSWRAGDATRILTGACFKEAALVTTTAGVRFDARIDPAQDPPLPRFSLVLFAMGLGEEQCVVDGHGGPAFWDADRICETNMGLDRPAHVLISGGGDGALQDFIRAVTGERSVLDIYQRLPLSASDKQRIEQTVFWAEDQYQRGAVWSTGNWDCELLTPLKIAYERLVESLPEAFWGELPTRVRIRVPEEFTIRLVHSCQHFSRCYPLNHFVARVLGTYLARLAAPPFVEGMRVSGIESTACNGAECHGKPHLARLIESRCRGERDTVQDAGRLDADVLLIRHGIRPPSPLTDAAFGVSRQMLPYYMPWGPPR